MYIQYECTFSVSQESQSLKSNLNLLPWLVLKYWGVLIKLRDPDVRLPQHYWEGRKMVRLNQHKQPDYHKTLEYQQTEYTAHLDVLAQLFTVVCTTTSETFWWTVVGQHEKWVEIKLISHFKDRFWRGGGVIWTMILLKLSLIWHTLYLSELLTVHNPGRALRSTNQLLLEVPKSKYKHWNDRAFSVADPRLWNKPPAEMTLFFWPGPL